MIKATTGFVCILTCWAISSASVQAGLQPDRATAKATVFARILSPVKLTVTQGLASNSISVKIPANLVYQLKYDTESPLSLSAAPKNHLNDLPSKRKILSNHSKIHQTVTLYFN